MKRLLTVLAATLICTPAFSRSDPKVKGWKTNDAMGCMMLMECKDGTKQVNSWKDLGPKYIQYRTELNSIFDSFDKLGIKVFVADTKYFTPSTRGLYNVAGNNLFINKDTLYNPLSVIQTIRHEGWHAVQDCMAGSLDNTYTGIVWDQEKIPDWVKLGIEIDYAHAPNAQPYEAEARWAAHKKNQTAKALKVCADPNVAMWDVYEPTPLTRKYLVRKGYIKTDGGN